MGRTEWAILVRTYDDALRWQRIASEHDSCNDVDQVGKELQTIEILDFKTVSRAARPKVPTDLYLLFSNGGGRWCTRQFFDHRRQQSDVILGIDDKPKNWMDCKEMVWTPRDSPEIPRSVFE